MWMHLRSYLVRAEELAVAYAALEGRNFFGRWMPEGPTWLYGFAGEYPWGTAFNVEPEWWHGRGGHRDGLPVDYGPAWSELAAEWEYDASFPRNIYMNMPARAFFSPGDLWWDGNGGYLNMAGKTIFRDPSIKESGPASLVVDADDLPERLEKLDMRLVWTLLGEKLISGGPDGKPRPRRTFSQIACLGECGAVQIGERAFFDDYERNTSPKSESDGEK
jgi:hypothetical protein